MAYLWHESVGLWPYFGKVDHFVMELPHDISSICIGVIGSLYTWARSVYKKNTMHRYSAWLTSELWITLVAIGIIVGFGNIGVVKPLTYSVSLLIIVGNWGLARAYMKSITRVSQQVF